MSRFDDLKKQYGEIKKYREDLMRQLDEIRHGHIHIPVLNIDYDVPDEVRSTHHWVNRIYIWAAASVLGLIAIGFAFLCDEGSEIFRKAYEGAKWSPFLITPFGLLGVRWIIGKWFRGSEGSGVPQTIAALSPDCKDPGALLSLKQGMGKIIGTVLGLMCGASIGREGPTVQLGGVTLRLFGRFLKAPVLYSPRSLILAGGAAGVSAAFNTPIAGIVFAIEELGKSFYEKETSVLLMAIVVSGLTALSISGQYFYFGVSNATMGGFAQFYALLVGVLCGLGGGLFSYAIVKGTDWTGKLKGKSLWGWIFVFGFLIALTGYLTGGATFGTGYDEARLIIGQPTGWVAFPFAKILTTVLSYLSGIPGGIFSPTLSIGAGLGAIFANAVNSPYYQAFVLLGMVGFFSGVIRSPITAVIIVSEMTHNHNLLFALLMSSLAAYATSMAIQRESLYVALAKRYL